MVAKPKIIVTEELKNLNPELLKDVNVGDKTDILPELVLKKPEAPKTAPQGVTPGPQTTKPPETPKEEMIEISKGQLNDILAKLKMLEEVADKGRLLNYETKNAAQGKKPMRAMLSMIGDGVLVGWRTMKDELIKHPTTGLTIGETQEFELLVLKPDDTIEKVSLSGYPTFSNARYNQRIEVEIVGKEEDFEGNLKFSVKLPDGRVTKLAAAFIN